MKTLLKPYLNSSKTLLNPIKTLLNLIKTLVNPVRIVERNWSSNERIQNNKNSRTMSWPILGYAIELPGQNSSIFGLIGPRLPKNPLEKVGVEAPHLFQWVLR